LLRQRDQLGFPDESPEIESAARRERAAGSVAPAAPGCLFLMAVGPG
jgi:hypothetical protein